MSSRSLVKGTSQLTIDDVARKTEVCHQRLATSRSGPFTSLDRDHAAFKSSRLDNRDQIESSLSKSMTIEEKEMISTAG
jgi:hypothetical protein